MTTRAVRHWLVNAPLLPALVAMPAQRLVCRFAGHVPVQDMCKRPQHDHCMWCLTILPGQAHP
jgi:hypothetical protein